MKIYTQDLFPQLRFYQTYWEKREYVESVLVELAIVDKLSLVDICNQPNEYASYLCGEVICGTMIQDKRCVEATIPFELDDYKVTIKPIGDYKIEYEAGWKQVGQLRNGLPLLKKVNRTYAVGKDGTAKLPLKDAWIAMHRYGKYVRHAGSERVKSTLWRFEEVQPEKAVA